MQKNPTLDIWTDLIPETEKCTSVVLAGGYIFTGIYGRCHFKVYQYDVDGTMHTRVLLPGLEVLVVVAEKRWKPNSTFRFYPTIIPRSTY